MSDQVEMVAAEDAADNKAGAVETTSAQPEGQQPEAPVVAAAAEVSAAVEPVASEVAVEAAAGSTEAVPEAVAAPEAVSVPEVAPEAEVAAEESAESGKRGNVRILAVGQQVQGAVKRIADFGASPTNTAANNATALLAAEATGYNDFWVPPGTFNVTGSTVLTKRYWGPGQLAFSGIGNVSFTGVGLNDAVFSGSYNGNRP